MNEYIIHDFKNPTFPWRVEFYISTPPFSKYWWIANSIISLMQWRDFEVWTLHILINKSIKPVPVTVLIYCESEVDDFVIHQIQLIWRDIS